MYPLIHQIRIDVLSHIGQSEPSHRYISPGLGSPGVHAPDMSRYTFDI